MSKTMRDDAIKHDDSANMNRAAVEDVPCGFCNHIEIDHPTVFCKEYQPVGGHNK